MCLGLNSQSCDSLKVLTHLKPPRRFCMLFFDALPFTDDASVINGKTSKKSMQKRRGGFWCVYLKPSRPFLSVNSKSSKKSMTDHVVSPRCAMLYFEILPFTYQVRRGVVRCVKTLKA